MVLLKLTCTLTAPHFSGATKQPAREERWRTFLRARDKSQMSRCSWCACEENIKCVCEDRARNAGPVTRTCFNCFRMFVLFVLHGLYRRKMYDCRSWDIEVGHSQEYPQPHSFMYIFYYNFVIWLFALVCLPLLLPPATAVALATAVHRHCDFNSQLSLHKYAPRMSTMRRHASNILRRQCFALHTTFKRSLTRLLVECREVAHSAPSCTFNGATNAFCYLRLICINQTIAWVFRHLFTIDEWDNHRTICL